MLVVSVRHGSACRPQVRQGTARYHADSGLFQGYARPSITASRRKFSATRRRHGATAVDSMLHQVFVFFCPHGVCLGSARTSIRCPRLTSVGGLDLRRCLFMKAQAL